MSVANGVTVFVLTVDDDPSKAINAYFNVPAPVIAFAFEQFILVKITGKIAPAPTLIALPVPASIRLCVIIDEPLPPAVTAVVFVTNITQKSKLILPVPEVVIGKAKWQCSSDESELAKVDAVVVF